MRVILNGRHLMPIDGTHQTARTVGELQYTTHDQALNSMLSEKSLHIQMHCRIGLGSASHARPRNRANKHCGLSVIVYGPSSSADQVGKYLQAYELYLQDPEYFDYNAPYLNPHCLFSSEGEILMTGSMQSSSKTIEAVNLQGSIFDNRSGVKVLRETETPMCMRTSLRR